jgi:AcrR family transcriptional regulator
MGRGAETRQVILGRAAQVASLVGLEGLTIGGLAGELRLSKSGLFAHFHSKEALQVETLRFAAQLFIDNVIRPALKSRRGEPRVRALFERWLDWAKADTLEGGCLFVAASAELDDREGPARQELVRRRKTGSSSCRRWPAVPVSEATSARSSTPSNSPRTSTG